MVYTVNKPQYFQNNKAGWYGNIGRCIRSMNGWTHLSYFLFVAKFQFCSNKACTDAMHKTKETRKGKCNCKCHHWTIIPRRHCRPFQRAALVTCRGRVATQPVTPASREARGRSPSAWTPVPCHRLTSSECCNLKEIQEGGQRHFQMLIGESIHCYCRASSGFIIDATTI